jgi:hypothetical protein
VATVPLPGGVAGWAAVWAFYLIEGQTDSFDGRKCSPIRAFVVRAALMVPFYFVFSLKE